MKLLAGVLMVLALLLGANNAYAQFPVSNETPYKDAEIAYDLKLAKSYWGKLPWCVETFMADIPGYWAWAPIKGCSIWIDRTTWPNLATIDRCEVIVHEVGHLLGHEHSDDPMNIMSPGSPVRSIPQCEPGYVLVQPKVKRRKRCKHRRKCIRRNSTCNARIAETCSTPRPRISSMKPAVKLAVG